MATDPVHPNTRNGQAGLRFAADSPLEGDGFEPSVPPRERQSLIFDSLGAQPIRETGPMASLRSNYFRHTVSSASSTDGCA